MKTLSSLFAVTFALVTISLSATAKESNTALIEKEAFEEKQFDHLPQTISWDLGHIEEVDKTYNGNKEIEPMLKDTLEKVALNDLFNQDTPKPFLLGNQDKDKTNQAADKDIYKQNINVKLDAPLQTNYDREAQRNLIKKIYDPNDETYAGDDHGDPISSVRDLVANSLNLYPNPVVDYANLNFTLQNPSEIRIEAYDATGRQLGTLYSGYLYTGDHNLSLNFRNYDAKQIFLRITSETSSQTISVMK